MTIFEALTLSVQVIVAFIATLTLIVTLIVILNRK